MEAISVSPRVISNPDTDMMPLVNGHLTAEQVDAEIYAIDKIQSICSKPVRYFESQGKTVDGHELDFFTQVLSHIRNYASQIHLKDQERAQLDEAVCLNLTETLTLFEHDAQWPFKLVDHISHLSPFGTAKTGKYLSQQLQKLEKIAQSALAEDLEYGPHLSEILPLESSATKSTEATHTETYAFIPNTIVTFDRATTAVSSPEIKESAQNVRVFSYLPVRLLTAEGTIDAPADVTDSSIANDSAQTAEATVAEKPRAEDKTDEHETNEVSDDSINTVNATLRVGRATKLILDKTGKREEVEFLELVGQPDTAEHELAKECFVNGGKVTPELFMVATEAALIDGMARGRVNATQERAQGDE